jgi:hypothetical protein
MIYHNPKDFNSHCLEGLDYYCLWWRHPIYAVIAHAPSPRHETRKLKSSLPALTINSAIRPTAFFQTPLLACPSLALFTHADREHRYCRFIELCRLLPPLFLVQDPL